jgi:phenylalanyl-tRNA synthetase beta chain
MLDLGQPNHAYDLDRLGGGGLLVRRGAPGERLVTLDGVERDLGAEDCVICDAIGAPVGVGGIMGGSQAEIGAATTRVLLEAAWFSPGAVARTGIRLGLHSEARVRFERGVDPQVAPAAVDRFVALLASIAATDEAPALRRGPTVDLRDPTLPAPAPVRVRTERINAILGTAIGDADVVRLLGPIGFTAMPPAVGVHVVQVPTWRLDVEREIDVIEEVARMWGYRRIGRTLPPGAPGGSGGLTARQLERRRLREVLAGAGYDEAWTSTFLAPGDLERAGLDPAAVEVENPLDQSESVLRTELLPGLLKAVKFNVDRQAEDVCLFEMGHVFALPGDEFVIPDERERLGVIVAPSDSGRVGTEAVAAAAQTWQYLADALRLQGQTMTATEVPGFHPTRAARLTGTAGRDLGAVGEVDPGVAAAYGLHQRLGYLTVDVDALLAEPRRPRQAKEVSRFPASDLDLAFAVADTVPAAAVRATLQEVGGDQLETIWLFDVYRGAQVGPSHQGATRRSLAFRLRFRALERTLADTELARLRQAAIDAVVATHDAELRA